MEYDRSIVAGPPEAESYVHQSTHSGGKDGHLRVKGPKVDTSVLGESITFPFSGRTAKNRFLKAPMTERLCKWNKEGEDINVRGFPTKVSVQSVEIQLFLTLAKDEIGV